MSEVEAERVWRRNLAALTAAVFIGFTGFTLVMPFLPIYISQMGVTDVGVIAAWTGVTLGVTPAMTAVFAPLWGRLADRFGRRLWSRGRCSASSSSWRAMAFATEPWHLFAFACCRGSLRATARCAWPWRPSPRRREARAVHWPGADRAAPWPGAWSGDRALVAGLVGLRATFFVTAVFYAVAFVLVLWMYTETPALARDGRPRWEAR